MLNLRSNILLNVTLALSLLVVIYYAFIINNFETKPSTTALKLYEPLIVRKANETYNVWLIFTRVSNKPSKRSPLIQKFQTIVTNLMNVTSVPLHFHLIIDEKSKEIAELELGSISKKIKSFINYKFYDIKEIASKVDDIVKVLQPYFSKAGSYYSDTLFYISLGLFRIAPSDQKRGVLLDCDLFFKSDVLKLFQQFEHFKPSALFGLAPELSPVYRHILHSFKSKHNTTFGEYYHDDPIDNNQNSTIHPRGFQGYNSGVVLINFDKLRNSTEFTRIVTEENVNRMTKKFKFHGHLGDQDFYTLLGFEYPELIQTIHCGFNRQICTWWRDRGYKDVFDKYFKCNHKIVVLHGNCNTQIPRY